MSISTLISTATPSGASSVAITSGLDSTYDEYMFVFTDIGAATDQVNFTFQCSIDGGSNYNVTTTSSTPLFRHSEAGTSVFGYEPEDDQAQGTGYNTLFRGMNEDADGSMAGILHLFSPSSTTYVKHYYTQTQGMSDTPESRGHLISGYFNDANDIDAISFKMQSGVFSGVIQMYGIA